MPPGQLIEYFCVVLLRTQPHHIVANWPFTGQGNAKLALHATQVSQGKLDEAVRSDLTESEAVHLSTA